MIGNELFKSSVDLQIQFERTSNMCLGLCQLKVMTKENF